MSLLKLQRRSVLLAAALPMTTMTAAQDLVERDGQPYEGAIFDVQAHAMKPSLLPAATGALAAVPFITEETRRTIADDIFATLADDLDGTKRRVALGKGGEQVVTVVMGFPKAPPQVLLRIAEETNEWMASRSRSRAGLIGTATLAPPPALAAAGAAPDGQSWSDKGLELLKKSIEVHGLRGVLLASNYDGVLLGDPVYEPYFALAERLKVPVIIHPAFVSVDAMFVPRRNIPTDTGYLNDQRTTLLDLVKAGTLEKYPNLVIIATHLGGGILTAIGRFEQLAERFPAENWYLDTQGRKQQLPHGVRHYLKKIYYDCNNATKADIVQAQSMVGDDHLLTGTDFPWTTDKFSRAVLGSLNEPLRGKLAYDNAKRLFSAPARP